MIPMDSKSCEWLFVGQNKNFDELDEVLGSKRGAAEVSTVFHRFSHFPVRYLQ